MKFPSPLRNSQFRQFLMKGSGYGEVNDFSNDSGLGISLDCDQTGSGITTSKIVLDENTCDAHFPVVEANQKRNDEEPPFKIPRTDYTTDVSLDPMLAVAGRQLYEELTKGDKFASSEQTKSQDLAQLQSLLREVIRKVSKRHEQDNLQNSFVISEAVATPSRSKSSYHRLERSNSSQQNSRSVSSTPGKNTSGRRISHSKRHLLPVSCPGRNKVSQLELRILSQPEEQHRARYLTEGSRGAVKDRKGTGFPTVKLFGYSQPVTLQVFIGTDQGKVQPHLFYQASKVCGKNSTPCTQKKSEGTTILEIDMLPDKDMTVSCDCVGILKERNVDVEQRLLHFGGTYNKKRSIKCRLVFRVNVPLRDGTVESLQVVSAPILCTQPPGIPEICRKSLSESYVKGNVEMFIIGKNFLKDTKVIFYDVRDDLQGDSEDGLSGGWRKVVQPEKEFLQQTHLICVVPPYHDKTIRSAVRVRVVVESSGKRSEAHTFTYTPVLEQLQSGVILSNIQMATSAKHSLDLLPAVTCIPSPENSLSSSLAVSSHSSILPQETPRLDFTTNLGPPPSQEVDDDTTVLWKAACDDLRRSPEVPLWMKPEDNSPDSRSFLKTSPPSEEKLQDTQCLRDLLTHQSNKLSPSPDLGLVISEDASRHSLGFPNGNQTQQSDASFGNDGIIGASCSSHPVDVLTTVSGDPMLMTVTTYPSIVCPSPAPLTLAECHPAPKAEATAGQGSIEQITMMTMLRDSELLQLINPSTFDNV